MTARIMNPPLFNAVRTLPLILTALRAFLGPVVICLALLSPNRMAFGACLITAFLSDVFDGIFARRLNVATPNLRRLDSVADTIFYLSAILAAWRLYPGAITERLAPLLGLCGLELVRYLYDLAKFGREASYHMWSSKLWGVALFVGFFALLALGISGLPVSVAIYVGIVADLEGLAISIVLREWKTDVPTILHALRLRSVERT